MRYFYLKVTVLLLELLATVPLVTTLNVKEVCAAITRQFVKMAPWRLLRDVSCHSLCTCGVFLPVRVGERRGIPLASDRLQKQWCDCSLSRLLCDTKPHASSRHVTRICQDREELYSVYLSNCLLCVLRLVYFIDCESLQCLAYLANLPQ